MHPQYQYVDHSDGEYANELQYLTSGRPNPGDGGYWENTRNEAVRYLAETPSQCAERPHPCLCVLLISHLLGSNYDYPQQDLSTIWQTGYQPSEFAQSIFQHTLSSMPYAYPTPPPGIAHSSSSLANALQEQPRPPRKVYEPETSTQFFNEFVTNKTKDLQLATPSIHPPVPLSKPPIPTPPATISSVPSNHPLPNVRTPILPKVTEPQTVTPKKRKHEDTESSFSKPQPPHQTPVNSSVLRRKDLSGFPKIPKKSQVYVEIPPRPSTWKSQVPTSQPPVVHKPSLTAHDRSDGVRSTASSTTQHRSTSAAGTTGDRTSPVKRTGGRDDRGALTSSFHLNSPNHCFEGPFEKLESLIDEIFESEDDLPQYPDSGDLRQDLFSLSLTVNYARPCLNPAIVSKITVMVGKISRPAKRRPPTSRGQNGAPNSARKDDGRMSDLEVPKILRLLKILERSVQTGEDLDPFKLPSEPQSSTKRSVTKRSGKGPKRVKASEPDLNEGDNPTINTEPEDPQESTVNLVGLLKSLATAKESVLAAECCISILSSDRLPKQVRTHDDWTRM